MAIRTEESVYFTLIEKSYIDKKGRRKNSCTTPRILKFELIHLQSLLSAKNEFEKRNKAARPSAVKIKCK